MTVTITTGNLALLTLPENRSTLRSLALEVGSSEKVYKTVEVSEGNNVQITIA